MRLITCLILMLTVSACGEGYNSAKSMAADSASNSLTAGENGEAANPVNLNGLKTDEGNALAAMINMILAQIGLNLQGLAGGQFSFNGSTVSTSLTVSCALGGTASWNASVSLGASVTLSSISASVSNGSGTLVFNDCRRNDAKGNPVLLDGTISLNRFSGTMNAALNLNGVHTYGSNSSSRVLGTLTVIAGNVNKTCPIDVTQTASINGSINTMNGFSSDGTISTQVNASICDQSFARSINLSY